MHLDIFVILRRQTPAASSSSFLSVEPWAALFIFVLWPGPRRREITVGELWYSPNEFHRWIISFFFSSLPLPSVRNEIYVCHMSSDFLLVNETLAFSAYFGPFEFYFNENVWLFESLFWLLFVSFIWTRSGDCLNQTMASTRLAHLTLIAQKGCLKLPTCI